MGNIKSVLRFLNRLSKTNENRSLLLRTDGEECISEWQGGWHHGGKSGEAGAKYESYCAHSEMSITFKCSFS